MTPYDEWMAEFRIIPPTNLDEATLFCRRCGVAIPGWRRQKANRQNDEIQPDELPSLATFIRRELSESNIVVDLFNITQFTATSNVYPVKTIVAYSVLRLIRFFQYVGRRKLSSADMRHDYAKAWVALAKADARTPSIRQYGKLAASHHELTWLLGHSFFSFVSEFFEPAIINRWDYSSTEYDLNESECLQIFVERFHEWRSFNGVELQHWLALERAAVANFTDVPGDSQPREQASSEKVELSEWVMLRKEHGDTVSNQMVVLFSRDLLFAEKTSKELAAILGCTEQAVRQADAWDICLRLRKQLKTERKNRRPRRRKK